MTQLTYSTTYDRTIGLRSAFIRSRDVTAVDRCRQVRPNVNTLTILSEHPFGRRCGVLLHHGKDPFDGQGVVSGRLPRPPGQPAPQVALRGAVALRESVEVLV